jgi:hypothetical protein
MPKVDIDNQLKKIRHVADRLDAWADSAEVTAKNMTDSDAKPWKNMQNNYKALAAELENTARELEDKTRED